MNDNKRNHFEFFDGLHWHASPPHDYKVWSKEDALGLRAAVRKSRSGAVWETFPQASTIDHFIWDQMVNRKADVQWCESLTLWTKDLEFNLMIFGKDGNLPGSLRCAYFPPPRPLLRDGHIQYWTKLKMRPPAKDREELLDLLPQLVLWNRYEKSGARRRAKRSAERFQRHHAYAIDPCRLLFQTIPVPDKFLEYQPLLTWSAPWRRAKALYVAVLRYQMYAGLGSPMQRNLLGLASMLADSKIRAALITGEPGTGKEAYCKALYFGNKLKQPDPDNDGAAFVQTTASEMQHALEQDPPVLPVEFLKKRISISRKANGKPKRPVIYIDELNKAKQELLGALLRPLEQGEEELGVEGVPTFILAASEHIDELAKRPPQDFWTRISHQLRVVHPLSRVSEEDAMSYLMAFFYVEWWGHVEEMIRSFDSHELRDFVHVFFGKRQGREIMPSSLCERIRDEFVNTLVPLVSRDTLSVRGARSILSQVFARLSWFLRFEKPFSESRDAKKLDKSTENQVAQRVNSAVQDVLAILNAARATPAKLLESAKARLG